MRRLISILLILLLFVSLCSCAGKHKDPAEDSKPSGTGTPSQGETAQAVAPTYSESTTAADMFTKRDYNSTYSENSCVQIQLSGNTAAASSKSVVINGSNITITEDKPHIISGTLNDGQITVNAPETAKLQIILNGANISCSSSAPLYILEADKVFLTLVGDNTLSSGNSFTAIDANNIDGTIYSKQDLTLNGNGTLTVNSPAGHGIVCKDDLVFTSGSYTVNSAAHALDANDSVRATSASFSLTSGKDGIHVNNKDDAAKGFVYISSGTFKIISEGDGISASAHIQILNGSFDILCGGGYENRNKASSDSWGGFQPGNKPPVPRTSTQIASDDASTSLKGLKGTSGILISGGEFKIDTADDALHANSDILVKGGTLNIASGDDAVHANGTLTVHSGDINITNSYEGLEALHICLNGGNIKIKATDDGINAAGGNDNSGMGGRDDMFGGGLPMGGTSSDGSVKISEGSLYINASGDGIDVNGTLEISGGHTTVCGPTQGDTAVLDFDKSGVITGGTFIGTGSANMAQSFSSSAQGVIAVNCGMQAAGTAITVSDADGNTILTQTPELSFQIVIISSPSIKPSTSYTLTIGSQSAAITAN